ncbi:hypothetical protein RS84_01125 [Microbacterium hydrocarbonoxydans]|uniref:Uncharacterized protein n=1 Tax=Microbacterium hydrocarbonoxydans TaxID=273678 RepID=A0A0M2HNU8_9MICO|nr:hypothetical protein [Microbacterium hydrocarbonoxydans]KJL48366.1 hypothetical protein RS84_01125 [Microbacterium hydrocarbonoxydans]
MTEIIPPTTRPGLPWPLIVGLSALALLWPLAELIGIGQGAPRALTIIAIIAVTWICVVGLGGVPRPVPVLALTGLGHGIISMIAAAIFGGFDQPVWTIFIALGIDAFWGAVAGLMALGIQKIWGSRA